MQVLAERYELGAPVGAGGMARVLRARDLLLERPVAVKLLREDIAAEPGVRDRFLREARTAAQFNHPNAVAVFDSGDHDGDPWIVMELVDGEDLSRRLRRTGALDEAAAVRIADCVLAALEAAHRQGIVHRDVKPANIMLLDDATVKLADFGIAKSVQDAAAGMTATGQIIGTARYLSPEQVHGRPSTAASDVYAMGIVLFEMLAGHAPYTGDTLTVAIAHTREPVPDVTAAAPGVSTGVAAVITRALGKDPAGRYADAGAMRAALAREMRAAQAGAGTTALAGALPAARAGAGTTAQLPEVPGTAGTDDDAPTLDPALVPATPTGSTPGAQRRRPPWLLLAAAGLVLLTVVALVAAGSDPPPAQVTTDTGIQPATTTDDDAADPPPARVTTDTGTEPAATGHTTAGNTTTGEGKGNARAAEARANGADARTKGKGNGRGNGRAGGNGRGRGR